MSSPRGNGTRRGLGRFAIDVSPLRTSRDFRLLWSGLFVSEVGWQFSLVGVFIQVTALTGSEAAVGLSGLVYLAGLVAGSLVGASVLDRWDRRRLLLLAQFGFIAGTAILLASALLGTPPLTMIYSGVAVIAAFSALDSPTRSAMTPRLVGNELIPSAQALNQVAWNGTALLGPALAGIVIQHTGVAWAYGIDLATYVVMVGAAWRIKPMPPEPADDGTETSVGWAAVREGFGYVRRSRLLQATFAIDLVAMIFGLPRALFTFLAVDQFGRGPELVGVLFTAPAVGALLGAVTSGWTRHVRRQGEAVVIAVALWGVAIVGFGLVGDRLWLALVCLAAAGWADVISAIFRSTILQVTVPDHLRGRLSGIHILVVTGGPRLGDLEAGLVAQAVSPTFSVVSGGLACIVGAWLVALAYPELPRYRVGARKAPAP